jgi:hypothetical protein
MNTLCAELMKSIRFAGEIHYMRSLLRILRFHLTIICTIISIVFCKIALEFYVHSDEQILMAY